MLSAAYSVEMNDVSLFLGKSLSGDDFYQTVIDHFDQLYADSAKSGRVMALALHPFIIGQPARHRHLERVLDYIASRRDVWLTTSDEIAAHYTASLRAA